MGRARRFYVSGIDDLQDEHTFSTDDRARAEAKAITMSGNWAKVHFRDTISTPNSPLDLDLIEQLAQARVRKLREEHPQCTLSELVSMMFPE
jgi:hypothetical protein